MDEIEAMKKKRAVAYGARGRDRGKMIEELQEINTFGDKKHLEAIYEKQRKMKEEMKLFAA